MKNQLYTPLHITKHGGKMSGIDSISTSYLLNPDCLRRQAVKGTVCQKCYSKKFLSIRPSLRKCLATNTKLLTDSVIPEHQLPTINARYFRFESFGDLINENHLQNFVNICKKNPQTMFALWTKNLEPLNLFATQDKPENLVIVYSSEYLNEPENAFWNPQIDHVFTVYEKQYAKDNGITINCGSRDCLGCLKCYHHGGDKYINEELK